MILRVSTIAGCCTFFSPIFEDFLSGQSFSTQCNAFSRLTHSHASTNSVYIPIADLSTCLLSSSHYRPCPSHQSCTQNKVDYDFFHKRSDSHFLASEGHSTNLTEVVLLINTVTKHWHCCIKQYEFLRMIFRIGLCNTTLTDAVRLCLMQYYTCNGRYLS